MRQVSQRLENLKQTALAAVSHVGAANYEHRERAARYAITISFKTGRYVDPNEVQNTLED